MRLFVTGTRGIPNILGGVETHCEALFPIIQEKGFDITIARRSGYITNENRINEYKGVCLVDIHSPKKKSIEAIIHTLGAVWYAKRHHFKYIHIHAIGPALVIPFARLLGLKVVMTHHGPDYDRQKWGKIAKASLKLGEWCAAKFANEIIVISKTINNILKDKYNRHDAHLIPNGVNLPIKATSTSYISSLGLKKQNYIIAVARFVPEKGFHDLIDAYLKSGVSEKLVLVGDADHESTYSKEIKKKAEANNVVLTGFIKGEKLNEIFTHAKLFVMPSYHEGLPIALLEAMSYNLNVLVSDIPANMEVELSEDNYFEVGNTDKLAEKLIKKLSTSCINSFEALIKAKYNWEIIAEQTISVYNRLINK
jgi:glycosyltransferase involved in cell wall biosynthesis